MNDLKGIIEDVEKSSLVSNKVIKKIIEIIGQEKWQDINDEEDDICTTAGELSITLRDIEELEKENAELKNRDCWKTCEYANPKAESIGQHIKDVQNLTKAKTYLKYFIEILKILGANKESLVIEAEQFIKDSEVENV